MTSESKRGRSGWDICLRTGKQRLAAFTLLLMVALGLITRQVDYDPQHLHVENESAWTTNEVTLHGRVPVDSGAMSTSVNTGTLGPRAGSTGLNVVSD
jgi:hypothetical protein